MLALLQKVLRACPAIVDRVLDLLPLFPIVCGHAVQGPRLRLLTHVDSVAPPSPPYSLVVFFHSVPARIPYNTSFSSLSKRMNKIYAVRRGYPESIIYGRLARSK